MKTNQLFLLTGLVAVTLPACVQKDKKGVSEKPMNILYIMCDDHSYQTISAYDHRFIETPNIDRIANEGVQFRRQLFKWSQSCLFADGQA